MLTIKQGIQLSAIIDKLGLVIKDAEAGQAAIGADLVMQLLQKAYKAEAEIYQFIATTKKISVEAAAEIDLVAFVQDVLGQDGVRFLASALKSAQDG